MILYHQAFDLYHTVYRMLQFLSYVNFDEKDYLEIDRVRIWDYYLLFPNKLHTIKLKKRDEKDIKILIERFIPKKDNPYETVSDDRKMFERIQTYQITALKCLASYGIIDVELWNHRRIRITSKEALSKYASEFEKLNDREMNLVKLLTSHFAQESMFGEWGLKRRSNLMETKYDAE